MQDKSKHEASQSASRNKFETRLITRRKKKCLNQEFWP